MYVLENTYTGRFLYPALMGKVKKMYRSKVEAEAAVERLTPLINPKRVDVVELSKSALLWLEAQQKSSPTPIEPARERVSHARTTHL